MADAHKNFAYSTVATAPSPAISGTSLVVQGATGTVYPTVPFNATVWPAGAQPLNSNAEIVRVTNISTDTLTIVRSQEGSSARTIVAGDQIVAGITAKTLTDIEPYINPTGSVQAFAGLTAPANWLLCNGQAVSRTTYATLFNLIMPSLGAATITIASPAVVSFTAHGLQNGDPVFFTTTGALPTGLAVNTVYYVTVVDANSFKLSTNTGGVGVVYINTSGTQSGTHTLWRCPYGLGDGSTTFNVPDLRGRVVGGVENMGGVGSASRLTGFANAPPNPLAIGAGGGLETHTLTLAQMASHNHGVNDPGHSHAADRTAAAYGASTASTGYGGNVLLIPGASGITSGSVYGASTGITTQNAGSDGAHNNVQPTLLMNYIIKT